MMEQLAETKSGKWALEFLISHLEELRWRLCKILLTFIVFTLGSYFYAPYIIKFFTKFVDKLYYMAPAEAFLAYVKVSMAIGFLFTVPVFAYQIWMFILPAMTQKEYIWSLIVIPLTVVLFWGGVLFAYFFVLPIGIKFFTGFASESMLPLFSIGQYLSFVISFLWPFGLIFELPLIVVILAKMNILTSLTLKKKRKVFIFFAFVIGAVLSPSPDVFSQIMIALPLILLFETSIFIVGFFLKK